MVGFTDPEGCFYGRYRIAGAGFAFLLAHGLVSQRLQYKEFLARSKLVRCFVLRPALAQKSFADFTIELHSSARKLAAKPVDIGDNGEQQRVIR